MGLLGDLNTQYTAIGASRLDRMSQRTCADKNGIETIGAAFTDHLAVCLHLMVDVPILRTERGYWKPDGTLTLT